MSKKNKWALGIILAFGLFIFLREFRDLSFHEVLEELQHLNWIWVIVGLCCMLMHWAIEAKIIQGLMKRTRENFSFKNAVRIPLIEHLFNAITPFSSGGQPAQLIAMVKSGVDAGISGSVLLMKFVVYQSMIVINFLLALALGFHVLKAQIDELSYFILLAFVIHAVVISSLLLVTFCYPVANKLVQLAIKPLAFFKSEEQFKKLQSDMTDKVKNFYEESKYIRSQKKLLLKTSLLTFIQLIFYFVVPYFILLALGMTHVNIMTIIILHTFIIMIISLFPIPGGAGGAEYSFTLLFGSMVTSPEKLVIALILWRVITHYTGILLGVVALGVQPTTEAEEASSLVTEKIK
ncbi:lysylphosphatidylglycerol synthase transmembrane domain-containing protein [Isobaculum melis]|uniref:Phosphatidylglycerol lysyltransferase n=1 Tax=Isobaculum melis TaxID=142588 RepID=A0A1H9T893_9LACT|nr:lysylphosphatidylglycerol synthase transmembrane domain-containing protein [Isobaculum melis]SER93346.1 hypothetical protein SAMN04488559_11144 [Isobaculum melis]